MKSPQSHRGFLGGLTTLPLIGGRITVIGQPTAAAEPITFELLEHYKSWLYAEAVALGREMYEGQQYGHLVLPYSPLGRSWTVTCLDNPASTRAAAILAAAGWDGTEGTWA